MSGVKNFISSLGLEPTAPRFMVDSAASGPVAIKLIMQSAKHIVVFFSVFIFCSPVLLNVSLSISWMSILGTRFAIELIRLRKHVV